MSIEDRVNRANTAIFIRARPTVVSLIPVAKVRTASGGTKLEDLPPRPAQTFRLIEQTTTAGNVPGKLQAGDGVQRQTRYQLLGEWDSVMEAGDHWTTDGVRYEVTEVLPYNGYERRGMVTQYG